MSSAPDYRWSPPEHPDPPEDRPLGIDADPAVTPVNGYPPVWVRVQFTRTGEQPCPGFVERASADRVFVHHVWLPRNRVTHRELKQRGRA